MRWACEALLSAFSDENIFAKNAATNFLPMPNAE
jgi:hypothetical protein